MSTKPASAPDLDRVRRRRGEILAIATQHGARNVRIFGSVARCEADEASDIDFLVDFEPGRSLFDLVDLVEELHTLLGCHVDVVTEGELRPRNRDQILADARTL